MTKLKFILTILLISVIFTNITLAQKKDKGFYNLTPEEKTEKIMERMKTNLDLSDEQYNSISSVVLNHVTEMKSLCDQNKESKEDFRKQRQEHRNKLDSEISTYLTEEQKQKKEEFRKNRKNKDGKFKNKDHKRHGKNKFTNKTPEEMSEKVSERMKTNLNLTDDQKVSVQKIFLDHFTEMKSLHEQKKESGEDFRDKMKEHKKSIEYEMKLVLTDEQFTTWQEKKKSKCDRKGDKKQNNRKKRELR